MVQGCVNDFWITHLDSSQGQHQGVCPPPSIGQYLFSTSNGAKKSSVLKINSNLCPPHIFRAGATPPNFHAVTLESGINGGWLKEIGWMRNISNA